jgi:hypothetical protein
MSRNFDYPNPNQGWAAKQMLAQVQRDAMALDAAIRNDDRIPAWTIEKLATGTDRIGVAARYLLYKTGHAPTYAGHYAGHYGGYNDETMGERVRRMAPSLLIFGLFVYGLHTAAGGWSPAPVRKRRAR